jgi:hypothetical protein
MIDRLACLASRIIIDSIFIHIVKHPEEEKLLAKSQQALNHNIALLMPI